MIHTDMTYITLNFRVSAKLGLLFFRNAYC